MTNKSKDEQFIAQTNINNELHNNWEWIFCALNDSRHEPLKNLAADISEFIPLKNEFYSDKCNILNSLNFSLKGVEECYSDFEMESASEIAYVKKSTDKKQAASLDLRRVGRARKLSIAQGSYSAVVASVNGKNGGHTVKPAQQTKTLEIDATGRCYFTDKKTGEKFRFYILKNKKGTSGKIVDFELISKLDPKTNGRTK